MVGRKQSLCTVLCSKLESLAFRDYLSTLLAALRHPIDFLVTCLASSKSPFLYIFHTERYVAMEIGEHPGFFIPEGPTPLLVLL